MSWGADDGACSPAQCVGLGLLGPGRGRRDNGGRWVLLSSGRHPNDVGGGLSGACNCWRIQAAVVVAAWVMAWCWVWLDWGGSSKEWLAPGMTWRVARGLGAFGGAGCQG